MRRLNCSRVFCVVTSCVQQYTSLWKWLEKIKHWNPARCRILLFSYLVIQSKHRKKCLTNCCCSLLGPISVLNRLDSTWSKPLSQIQTPHGPLLRFRFLGLFMDPLLLNFSSIVERRLLIWSDLITGFQQRQHRTWEFFHLV